MFFNVSFSTIQCVYLISIFVTETRNIFSEITIRVKDESTRPNKLGNITDILDKFDIFDHHTRII